MKRFNSLDGWRGISILCVLAGHLFPLGPKNWQMNATISAAGMVLFFILSGFLITTILLKDRNVINFLIRRFLRIIPLAWLVILITLLATSANKGLYLPHFFFYSNWGDMALIEPTAHFWSLCVEVQFYILIAVLVWIFQDRAFILIPFLALGVTFYRVFNGAEMSIRTYFRIDEILAGCLLALLYHNRSPAIKRFFTSLNPLYLLPLLLLACHPATGALNYPRPYIAMVIVGITLFQEESTRWNRWLGNRTLFYIASISYALYIFHGVLMFTWLGDGDTLEKYAKRPLLLGITFLLAHLSTFYYEKYWIDLGKKLTIVSTKT